MALIKCNECEKEISDMAASCPGCGCPIKIQTMDSGIVLQSEDEDLPDISFSKYKKKAWIIGGVALLLVIVGIIVSVFIYQRREEIRNFNVYIETLELASFLMLTGGSDAETITNLTRRVWNNSIRNISDSSTNRFTIRIYNPARTSYTRAEFLDDFNDALANLFNDRETTRTVTRIRDNQALVNNLIDDLHNPPDGAERIYDAILDMFLAYSRLTDLAINPRGSLQSFSEDVSTSISEFVNAHRLVQAVMPTRIEE
ncbi:MAG: hypothetical protein FWE02_01145 [Defluviitaleaceae bacterium]|nr:hypothetical protein [Defluviitaleaceae bacterium]